MKRDYKQFPRNGNGNVLWGLRTSGDALTEPRLIDFGVIFPSKKDRAFLQRVGGKRAALVTSRAAAIHAGACLHANWRMDYFYVADPRGLKSALQKFHRKECPGGRAFFRTQGDPRWKCYLEWLYPNEATIKHYRAELEELGTI